MRTRIQEAYGKLPLSFEPNQGQTEARVKFVARGSGYSLFLTPQEAILALHRSRTPRPRNWGLGLLEHNQPSPELFVLRMQLVGADPEPLVTGVDELPSQSNYLIGNDRQRWHTRIPHYRKVRYEKVYPGVDLGDALHLP